MKNKDVKQLIDIAKINTFIYRLHEKGMKMDYHSHKEIEIAYVVDGKVELQYFNKKKLSKLLLLPKQLLLINKNVVHKLKFHADTTLMVLEIEDVKNKFIDFLLCNDFYKEETKIIDFFKNREPSIKTLYDTASVNEKMKYLIDFEKRLKESPKNDLKGIEFDIYFNDFLLSIYKCYLNRSEQKNSHIDECLNYIHNNLSSELTIENIAKEINLSETYLKQLFKKEMGTSLYNYVINKRINLAIEYLKTTSLSQKEIAQKSGFKTYNSFYKCFTQQTNKKPKDFQINDAKSMQYFNDNFKKIINE